jgi:hypothetical protein
VPADREQSRRLTATRFAAPLIFAALVVATVAAFAYAQRLKREPLILDKVSFSPLIAGRSVITPNGDGHDDFVHIRFRLTKTDRGVVEVIDRDDRPVRKLTVKILSRRNRVTAMLPPGAVLPAFKDFAARWNGRTDKGRLVPTGPYRLRVKLLGEDRNLVPVGRIRVHTLKRASSSEHGG